MIEGEHVPLLVRNTLPSRYGLLAHAVIMDAIRVATRCAATREWLADTTSGEVGTLKFWCEVLSLHLGMAIPPEEVAKMVPGPRRRVTSALLHRIGGDQKRDFVAKGRGGYRYGDAR
jgi:hypothetical protein